MDDNQFNLSDYFTFRYFILPTLIRVLYFIGAVLLTAGPIVGLVQEFRSREGVSAYMLVSLVLTMTLGNLVWRITCELFMLLFSIYESVHRAQQNLEQLGKTPTMSPAPSITSQPKSDYGRLIVR